jgi:hypothetical protein
MMFLWSASGVPFGAYAIVQNFNIPIQIQPQCFCLFCLVNWGQCMYYSRYASPEHSFSHSLAFLTICNETNTLNTANGRQGTSS